MEKDIFDAESLQISVNNLINSVNHMMYAISEDEILSPDRKELSDIKDRLNKIFPQNKCKDVLYTQNTDKLFFGIKISPIIKHELLLKLILGEEPICLEDYKIEFDSKLFSMNVTAQEVVAYMLYDITSMMASYESIDQLRAMIDTYLTSEEDVWDLRDSSNYAQLVTFAIKDSLTKMTSLVYKDSPEEYAYNNMIQSMKLDEALISIHDTIINSLGGPMDSLRSSNLVILQWMFIMYKDMALNSSTVMEQLRDALTTTGSQLEIFDIKNTIDSVNSINNSIPMREDVDIIHFLKENSGEKIVNELSLFAGLKKNGLRSIEDSLYEYKLMIKNLETEEDAMYVMRSINNRIAILQDYIYNTEKLSPAEEKHYQYVIDQYMQLREELTKKKIWNKKQYGIWIDYDQMGESSVTVCPECGGNKITFGESGACTCNECGCGFNC